MKTIYKRNTVLTFLIAMFLMIPALIMFLKLELTIGGILVLIILILTQHHYGIKYDENTKSLITYSGFRLINITKRIICISKIKSYKKRFKLTKQTYDLPRISYNTSNKICNLILELEEEEFELLSGSEKSIDKVIDYLKINKKND